MDMIMNAIFPGMNYATKYDLDQRMRLRELQNGSGFYAEGGEVETGGINPQMPEVQNAIAAIMGDPNVDPQQAMGALYLKLSEKYGEEQAAKMIQDLVAMVQQSGGQSTSPMPEAGGPAMPEVGAAEEMQGAYAFGGEISRSRVMPEAGGPDGMADDMSAVVDGQEAARINSGELVVSRPDLAAVGSGDPDKGIDKVTNLLERVRQEHYGSRKHPDRVDFEGIAARTV